mmetsp:Transcript_83932/g.161974  ORF Transcript_83932/g.161974 Transcript_83932/m.161974 type:complete len:355 (+) Transcript_83932:43-1107(+)
MMSEPAVLSPPLAKNTNVQGSTARIALQPVSPCCDSESPRTQPIVFNMDDADEESWWGSCSPMRSASAAAVRQAQQALAVVVAERNTLRSQLTVERAKCQRLVLPGEGLKSPLSSVEGMVQHAMIDSVSRGLVDLDLQHRLALFIADSRRRLQEQVAKLDELEGHAISHVAVDASRNARVPSEADSEVQDTDNSPKGSPELEQTRQALLRTHAQLRFEEERKLAAHREANVALRGLEVCQAQLAASKDEMQNLELTVEELRSKLRQAQQGEQDDAVCLRRCLSPATFHNTQPAQAGGARGECATDATGSVGAPFNLLRGSISGCSGTARLHPCGNMQHQQQQQQTAAVAAAAVC